MFGLVLCILYAMIGLALSYYCLNSKEIEAGGWALMLPLWPLFIVFVGGLALGGKASAAFANIVRAKEEKAKKKELEKRLEENAEVDLERRLEERSM